MCRLPRRLLAIVVTLTAGAWICLVEPAKIFRAKIAELLADGVIGGAALSLFRRRLPGRLSIATGPDIGFHMISRERT